MEAQVGFGALSGQFRLVGADPADLAAAARIGEAEGYDEINLNVGCPSDRVQSGRFGACLMREPELVAECMAAMGAAVKVPVTVKCRIGVDDQDPEESLFRLVELCSQAGVKLFVVHARKALLKGLSPEVNGLLREAFTPTRPKQRLNSLFIGRTGTLRRIISAIEEERAHVILFGDRGRGKTSLANAVEQIAAQAGYMALKQTCSSELTFEEIFRHFLKKIPSTYFRATSGHAFTQINTFQSFAELLPRESFSVTELNEVLGSIHGTHVLMILDEYDRVTDEDFRNKLAELFEEDMAGPKRR